MKPSAEDAKKIPKKHQHWTHCCTTLLLLLDTISIDGGGEEEEEERRRRRRRRVRVHGGHGMPDIMVCHGGWVFADCGVSGLFFRF
jgi:hypothetical protein